MSQAVPDRPDGPHRFGDTFQPSAQADDDVRLMVQLLDLQDAAPPIRRIRDWGLAAATVRPGEVVVDVGSGTGTMAREMGPLVSPGGRVTGVEPNARLRVVASERAGDLADVEFIDGRAGALPFADGTISQDEADQAVLAVADAARAGTAISAVTIFGFVARKASR